MSLRNGISSICPIDQSLKESILHSMLLQQSTTLEESSSNGAQVFEQSDSIAVSMVMNRGDSSLASSIRLSESATKLILSYRGENKVIYIMIHPSPP